MNESFDQFTLKKVKYIEPGNVYTSSIMEEIRDDEIYHNKNKIESNKLPHPDFINLLTRIIPMAKRVFMYGEEQTMQGRFILLRLMLKKESCK